MNFAESAPSAMTSCLVEVGEWLRAIGYRFITATPATHARVNRRAGTERATNVRDIFGWSRPFEPALLPLPIAQSLLAAGLVEQVTDGVWRSEVRYSSLGDDLYAHSAFPTEQADAVFFGPDTYRFASLIQAEVERAPLPTGARILDVGAGAGPGGIAAARAAQRSSPGLTLTDINAAALRFACANAALAGVDASLLLGDLFEPVEGEFDLIVSNPPYLNDSSARTYRHGGGEWGGALSERIVREGIDRLAPGGRLVLYTGVAIVDGRDPFIGALHDGLDARGWPWRYRELDPDVFGEELEEPAYERADRIAAVALVVTRPVQ